MRHTGKEGRHARHARVEGVLDHIQIHARRKAKGMSLIVLEHNVAIGVERVKIVVLNPSPLSLLVVSSSARHQTIMSHQ